MSDKIGAKFDLANGAKIEVEGNDASADFTFSISADGALSCTGKGLVELEISIPGNTEDDEGEDLINRVNGLIEDLDTMTTRGRKTLPRTETAKLRAGLVDLSAEIHQAFGYEAPESQKKAPRITASKKTAKHRK